MIKKSLITLILMMLLSCNSSGDEHIEAPTVEPYKIVIAFYDSSYKSSPYSQGSDNADSYLSWIYFENNGYNVWPSDITEVIYNLPTIVGTEIIQDLNGEPRVIAKDNDGTVTDSPPYSCWLNGKLILKEEVAESCSAQMSAQGLANFTFSADDTFQIDLDIYTFYKKLEGYNALSEDIIMPISVNFEDYFSSDQIIYLCIDIATSEVKQTIDVEFVPEVRVICNKK